MTRVGCILAAGLILSVTLPAHADSVDCWGIDSYGIASGTPSGNDYVDVAVGYSTAYALGANGGITAWGDDMFGQRSGTPTANDFKDVESGWYFGLGLHADGSIESWGVSDGNLGLPAGDGFKALAAGAYNGYALHSDGWIASWGSSDFYGQVSGTPTGSDFVAITATYLTALALRADGSISAWGFDGSGLVSDAPEDGGYVAIGCCYYGGFALRADGTIHVWGTYPFLQTPSGDDFVRLCSGSMVGYAIRTDGSMAAIGNPSVPSLLAGGRAVGRYTMATSNWSTGVGLFRTATVPVPGALSSGGLLLLALSMARGLRRRHRRSP